MSDPANTMKACLDAAEQNLVAYWQIHLLHYGEAPRGGEPLREKLLEWFETSKDDIADREQGERFKYDPNGNPI